MELDLMDALLHYSNTPLIQFCHIQKSVMLLLENHESIYIDRR